MRINILALTHVTAYERSVLDKIRLILDVLSAVYRETIHVRVRDGIEALHVGRINRLECAGAALRFVVKCFGITPGSFMSYTRGHDMN